MGERAEMSLPTDRDARNDLPVWDGCIAYFPDTWAEIAKVSVLGNAQHGLGAKLHFARAVSTDHLNKVMRHCLDHAGGAVFDDGGKTRHLAKAAWRILAALQMSIEEDAAKNAMAAAAAAAAAATVPAGTPPPPPPIPSALPPPHKGAPVHKGKCGIGGCWCNAP